MTTREVAEICGVDERTIQVNAKKVGIELGSRWNPHDFTEEEVKRVQAQLMVNSTNQGNSSVVVKESAKAAFGEGLSLQVIMDSGNLEALEEFVEFARKGTQAKHDLLLAQEQNRLLLEQKEEAERAFLEEKEDNEKNKELVRHKYLSATEVKDKVHELTGKWVVVSKAVKRIPLDENDVLYKPFTNNGYTGQTKVYHPSVVDKIAESLY